MNSDVKWARNYSLYLASCLALTAATFNSCKDTPAVEATPPAPPEKVSEIPPVDRFDDVAIDMSDIHLDGYDRLIIESWLAGQNRHNPFPSGMSFPLSFPITAGVDHEQSAQQDGWGLTFNDQPLLSYSGNLFGHQDANTTYRSRPRIGFGSPVGAEEYGLGQTRQESYGTPNYLPNLLEGNEFEFELFTAPGVHLSGEYMWLELLENGKDSTQLPASNFYHTIGSNFYFQ